MIGREYKDITKERYNNVSVVADMKICKNKPSQSQILF